MCYVQFPRRSIASTIRECPANLSGFFNAHRSVPWCRNCSADAALLDGREGLDAFNMQICVSGWHADETYIVDDPIGMWLPLGAEPPHCGSSLQRKYHDETGCTVA